MVKVIQEVGKRKTAIAQAILKPGKGVIRVNNIPVDKCIQSVLQVI